MIPWVVRYGTFPLHLLKTKRRTLHWLGRLQESQWWSPGKLRDWQEQKLRGLLRHASQNVPYYQDLFRAQGIEIEKLSVSDSDWRKIPLLSKDTVRKEFDRLHATDRTRSFIKVETSGSTGFPVKWNVDQEATDLHHAVKFRSREWWSFRIGDPHVWLWGDDEILGSRKVLRDLWLYNKRVLRLLDLSQSSVEIYFRKLLRWKPAYLYGYPSGFMQFAQLCVGRGLAPRSLGLKGIISTAEILTEAQGKYLRQIFGCPAIDEYGCAEAQVIAFECPEGNMHMSDDALRVEFLKNGLPVEPGQLGEVVVTDLYNEVMPLIRYRTGDMGSPLEGQCPCGRGLSLMHLTVGREVDMIRLPNGEIVHPEIFTPPHNNPFFQPLSHLVKQFRVVQETPTRFRIQVVADESQMKIIQERFVKLVHHYLGEGFDVEMERVSDILREPSGKLRYFVSHV